MCLYIAGTLGSPPASNTNLVRKGVTARAGHADSAYIYIYTVSCGYARMRLGYPHVRLYFLNSNVFYADIVLKVFFENVIKDAVTYTEHTKKKT